MLKHTQPMVVAASLLVCGYLTGICVAQRSTASSLNLVLEQAINEYALSGEQLQHLTGKKVSVLLTNGDLVEDLTVVTVLGPKKTNLIKAIKAKPIDGGREKTFPVKQIHQLELGKLEFPLKYLPSKRASVIYDVQRRNRETTERLRSQRDEIWNSHTESELNTFVAEEKAFLAKVGEHFSRLPMKMYETKYFLFFTNMPPDQIGPYLRNLDAMNEQLGTAFGFPPGRNIWKGKAVVIAFIEQRDFLEFERVFMDYPIAANSFQALCHSFRNGRVVVGCWRGDDPIGFATTLVHETAHGYIHRYMTSANVLSWLNEGIADWIAQAAVARSTETRLRQQVAMQRVRQLGGLDASFFGVTTETIESWHYGVSSAVVQILLDAGAENFRLFIDGIKEGRTWEESLMRAYRLSPAQLISHYNRACGVTGPRTR